MHASIWFLLESIGGFMFKLVLVVFTALMISVGGLAQFLINKVDSDLREYQAKNHYCLVQADYLKCLKQ